MDNRDRRNKKINEELGEKKEFTENVVTIDRVSRVVKGGRRFRFRALVVVGNGKGKVGIGVSKAGDVQAAVQKATEVAKRNVVEIALYKNTIPHEVLGKVAGARIFMKPAAEGTGLKAGGVVRVVLEGVGVHNILSKSLGSSNKINCAYATVEALQQLVGASDWVTNQGDGKKTAPKKVAAKEGSK